MEIFNLSINKIIGGISPMIVIFLSIISSLRIAWLINNRKRFVLYKELLSLLFILYIMVLFYVVTFDDFNYGISNYQPFKEIMRYDFLSYKFIKNNIGNIVMFAPYAFFVAYYLKTKSAGVIILMSTIASLSIELTQHYLVERVFDIDDVILNVIGGIVGFYIFRVLDRVETKLPKFMKSELAFNVYAVVALTLMVGWIFDLIHIPWSLK